MDIEVLDGRVVIDETLVGATPAAISRQVREYERGERLSFDLPISVPDSFTGRVMAAIAQIPVGETRSYGELAADHETAPIAVGGGLRPEPGAAAGTLPSRRRRRRLAARLLRAGWSRPETPVARPRAAAGSGPYGRP